MTTTNHGSPLPAPLAPSPGPKDLLCPTCGHDTTEDGPTPLTTNGLHVCPMCYHVIPPSPGAGATARVGRWRVSELRDGGWTVVAEGEDPTPEALAAAISASLAAPSLGGADAPLTLAIESVRQHLEYTCAPGAPLLRAFAVIESALTEVHHAR